MTWQADPGWMLAEYDAAEWGRRGVKPPDTPPGDAELAQPPIWATLYVGGRPVATWFREVVP